LLPKSYPRDGGIVKLIGLELSSQTLCHLKNDDWHDDKYLEMGFMLVVWIRLLVVCSEAESSPGDPRDGLMISGEIGQEKPR